MRPAGLILLSVAILSGCTEPEQRAALLEEALAGTKHHKDPAKANKTQVPLQGAAPHHLRMSGTFVLRHVGAGSGRSIEVTRNVYRGKSQAFRIEEMRFWTDPIVAPEGRQDGREVVFDGQELSVKRSWGPWMEREGVGAPQERLLTSAHDIAPSLMDAFGPYMVFRPDPEGETTLMGMEVRWERVGLDLAVKPKPLDAETLNMLREHDEKWKTWIAASHKALEIQGRIARRIDSGQAGEVVAGKLKVQGIASWEQEQRDFIIVMDYEIAPLSPHTSFARPEERVPARRERPWNMVKEALGEDLRPPYRR